MTCTRPMVGSSTRLLSVVTVGFDSPRVHLTIHVFIIYILHMKCCSFCLHDKPFSDFNKNKAKKDGLQQFCRVCSHSHFQKYYAANKEHHRSVVMRRKSTALLEKRKKLFDYLLEHSCVDCGEADLLVLDFDHVRGKKVSSVTTMLARGRSWKVIEKEIQKCEVRCANCHRRKTAREGNSHRWRLNQAQVTQRLA